uniref:DnaJ subfamily C member 2 protein putative n=1 Tax=Albugo laibachii Nc14 TaxID=890382 RepID=F0WSC4_9STRA|nr:DnaJ subfamily C member 2 protein putative [Albugo laibachii Nc14]CCA25881.1 DnaJ subfamily C member 2 protein putative [Albugo laibachii Nc14]|eukprot:CCA25881.1 DnaJ subfamily C member 2 protein putative [Albugo laibachii Nc14]
MAMQIAIPLDLSVPSREFVAATNDTDGIQLHNGLGGYTCHHKTVFPAGRAFHRYVKNAKRGRSMSCESVDKNQHAKNKLRREEEKILKKYRKSIRNRNFLELTMYEQLGLGDIGFDATEEDIKKAYHRVLIEHHPDKTGKTENDPNYLAVQTAYTTLMDPAKKRSYDSLCEFDEWIPLGTEKIMQNESDGNGKDYYTLYGSVFTQNARFSKTQPVPLLGDDNTELEDVYAFYDFWLKFDSWREFTHDAEHDVESAEHRDHKRWMAKKNDVVAKKKKKKEYARLATLVDRAMANDPRIRRAKRAEKDKKLAEKRRKEMEEQRVIDQKKQAEEEAVRIAREEEEKEKELRKNAKLNKEKQKKLIRKVKKTFRELMAIAFERELECAIDCVQTEHLCDTLEMEELQRLVSALGDSIDTLNASALSQVTAALDRVGRA